MTFRLSKVSIHYLQITKAATYGYCLKNAFNDAKVGNDPIPPARRESISLWTLEVFGLKPLTNTDDDSNAFSKFGLLIVVLTLSIETGRNDLAPET